MQLRARISEELQARLANTLPQAMDTAWDASAVLVVESLSFKPASGFEEAWKNRVSFEGVVRAELRSDKIDDLEAEALIVSVLTNPIFIKLPQGEGEIGAHHIKARLEMTEWRDAIRDQMVVAALRFSVSGKIYEFVGAPSLIGGEQ